MVQTKLPSEVMDFTLLTQASGCVPVLQIAPVFLDSPLKRVTIQLSSRAFVLSDPALWMPVPEVVNKPASLQITDISPAVPIVVVIRWLAKVPIPRLIEKVVSKPASDGLIDIPSSINTGVCPLTCKVITIPVRSIKCLHCECFDLPGFLAMACANNDWTCPICHKRIFAEDLRVDVKYFLKTITPPV